MTKPQGQKTIKVHNYKMVLNIIKENTKKNVSRAKIAKMTGMSPTSITRIVSILMQLGLVHETDSYTAGVGRKAVLLDIVKDALYVVGASIDSDYLNICIINFNDDLIDEIRVVLENRHYTPEEIIEIIFEQYRHILKKNKIDESKVVYLGISCAGNINNMTGEAVFVPQLNWENVDLKKHAKKFFDLPVSIDNDTKMSLVGAVRRTNIIKNEDVAYITIGTGLGSAIMYNGQIVRGVNNAAGEIGHTIYNPKGRLCDCGRHGCLQTYLTEHEIVKNAKEILPEISTFEELMDLYEEKDPGAYKVIDDFCVYVAILINNISYIYNPKYILVAGKLIFNFPVLFDLSIEKVRPLMHDTLYKDLVVKRVVDRDNAAYGASLVAQISYIDQLLKDYEI